MNPVVFLTVALLLSGCNSKLAIRQINVTSSQRGWISRNSSLTVVKRAKAYWASGQEIPAAVVNELGCAALATKVERPDQQNLGITEPWLDKLATQALTTFENDRHVQLTQLDRNRFIATFQNRRLIQESLETALLLHTDDLPEMRVDLMFENGEHVQLYSRSQYSFMLPWTVKRNGKYTYTYDAGIARAIARIVPPQFVNSQRLNDAKLRFDIIHFVTRYNKRLLAASDGR